MLIILAEADILIHPHAPTPVVESTKTRTFSGNRALLSFRNLESGAYARDKLT
jgi:hypothetical protein